MAMEKTKVDGKFINKRTADMLAMWEFNALTHYYVVQGSYNRGGVSASAGTHDGGGALDISVATMTNLPEKKWHVKQGRLAGFAAWYRFPLPGVWGEHIHAIAMGDPEASAGAKLQMEEYRKGQNGLANHAPDPDPRVSPIPVWPVRPLKKISALVVINQFKSKNPTRKMSVKRVQWVLNEKLGTNLPIDGVAGPKTRAAFKRWEQTVKGAKADGIPGKITLNKLGEGRFKADWISFEKDRRSHSKQLAALRELHKPTFVQK